MIRGNVQVWLATQPVDMRKSFDRLAEHVRAFLGHDPLSGSLFVFRSRSAQRIKILSRPMAISSAGPLGKADGIGKTTALRWRGAALPCRHLCDPLLPPPSGGLCLRAP